MLNQFEKIDSTKICSKCLISKSLSEFRKNKVYRGEHTCWCKPCEKQYQAEFFKKNQKDISARHKNYRQYNPEKHRFYVREWKKRNLSYVSRSNDLRRERYKNDKDKILSRNKNFYNKNKKVFLAKNAKRKAVSLMACPKWACKKEIRDFYKKCPDGYHVDHIIPLQGKNVCGLHVIWNLQYLTPEENLRKGNKV